MKTCEKCQENQSDANKFCSNCGNRLDNDLPELIGKENKEQNSYELDSYDDNEDYFIATTAEKVVRLLLLITAIISFVLSMTGYRPSFFYVFVVAILMWIEAAFPKVHWEFEKFRLSRKTRDCLDYVRPSDFYLVFRRVIIYIVFAIIVFMFGYAINETLNPPQIFY